jgi:hypothetical protein
LGTSQPFTVSGRVVEPIVPSFEKRTGVCSATWSTRSAWAKKALTPRRAAGLSAPASSFQATLISWPEYPLNSFWVSSLARFDSDPGVW